MAAGTAYWVACWLVERRLVAAGDRCPSASCGLIRAGRSEGEKRTVSTTRSFRQRLERLVVAVLSLVVVITSVFLFVFLAHVFFEGDWGNRRAVPGMAALFSGIGVFVAGGSVACWLGSVVAGGSDRPS